jgi:putative PepSY-like beta-lactamase-inhibitor
MKKLLLITVLAAFISFGVNAQQKDIKEKDVPEAVRTAFKNQFDNTMMTDWKMKDDKYKVMFTMNMKKHMAEFSSSGELLSKGEKINIDQLPTKVADAVKTGYASSNIDEVYRIEKGGQTQYLVKLEGKPEKKIVYDAQGNVVKEKME